MRFATGLFVTFAALALAAAAPPAEEGFASLFDGKSLAGWHTIGAKAAVWRAEDGLLVCSGAGGGWLARDKTYGDFVIRLEFRLSPGSNSGVYLRAPAETSRISRTGMEIQILDDTHERYKSLKNLQYTGSVYDVKTAEPGHLKPAGEWNEMEIRAEGPHVVVRLNGVVVVDDHIDRHPDKDATHPGLKRKDGLIGLQSHNDRVEFRQIRLKELVSP